MQPIRWSSFEYEERHRGADWYWALGIIALAGASASVIFGNILFAFVIVLGAFTLALYGARKPRELEFEIHEKGVVIGERLYPYRTLESFWIPEDGPARIILHSKHVLVPQIIIPLSPDVSEYDVHDTLSRFLQEEEHSESLAERLADWFGF